MRTKSPFFIVDNFLSPMECESIINRSFFEFPNMENGKAIKSITRNITTEDQIVPYLEDLIDILEDYYEYEHFGILPLDIEYYPERSTPEGIRCENSMYNGKWMLKNDYTLTGVIFLKDDNLGTDFDEYFEVHGAKLQFPNHQFGFRPERGQLIIFPSGPNFLNHVIPPKLGDMYQIRFQIVGSNRNPEKSLWRYDESKFPGDYRSWF